MSFYEVRKDRFLVSTDQTKFELDVIHGYLSTVYWSEGIPKDLLARAIAHSLCFALYEEEKQIGFARVISDFATFGYLADVFILDAHQKHGLGTWLMECIMKHPSLQDFRRWMLVTRDAHGLYGKFGFVPLAHPERVMEISRMGMYKENSKIAE